MNRNNIELLRKKDFTRFISTRITQSGDKLRTLCVFHDENTASFFIYPNNTFYCFGCGVHGNSIDFVMKKFGYTFVEACKFLENI